MWLVRLSELFMQFEGLTCTDFVGGFVFGKQGQTTVNAQAWTVPVGRWVVGWFGGYARQAPVRFVVFGVQPACASQAGRVYPAAGSASRSRVWLRSGMAR